MRTRVLLYSGGMDSWIAADMWQPDVLLYAALGHRYQAQELDTIARSNRRVTVEDRLRLGDLERLDGIIPLRNLYLVALATHHGPDVALGALAGEVNPDKGEPFRLQAQQVLTTCYGPSYWSDGDPVRVHYPLACYTKAELVARYLAQGGDGDELVAVTRSCYSGTDEPCGWCAACVKRHIALAANGLSERTERPPATSPYLRAMVARWATYDAKRKAETLAAFPDLLETA